MSHLLELALASGRVTNPPGRSSLHGEDHWKSVALLGLELARHTRRSDLRFIYSFAVLHDLCRENDGDDLQHGLRAAHLFDGLVADGYECPWAADLSYAIAHHVGSGRAPADVDVNVGLCWDADRLNLWRVGIRPHNEYLTTRAARTKQAQSYALMLWLRRYENEPLPSWDEIREVMYPCQTMTSTAS